MEDREQGARAVAAAFHLGWDDGLYGRKENYGPEVARRIGAKCARRLQPTCLRHAYRAGYVSAMDASMRTGEQG